MKARFWGHAGLGAHAAARRPRALRRQHVVRARCSTTGATSSCSTPAPASRGLGESLPARTSSRVDVLLTHLHMDHILGLGFFRPPVPSRSRGAHLGPVVDDARRSGAGSPGTSRRRCSRSCCATCRATCTCTTSPLGHVRVPGLAVDAALVCHPGPTVGYRLDDGDGTVAYLSDHEPALRAADFPGRPEWTSGFDLAHGVDVLIHDAQYWDEEYADHVGWGHSAIGHVLAFAELRAVGHLVLFHHDPGRDDAALDRVAAELSCRDLPFGVTVAREGEHVSTDRHRALPS